jgi:prepilin-type N-terminal cleavage/methylation domain-containing protein
MIFRIIRSFANNRAGFTLIEIIAAMSITGLIGLGASIATGQVINQTTRNNDYTTASRNAVNALHWLSRDALMAQTVNGTAGFPLTQTLSMRWRDWDNAAYTANYTVANGQLRRVFSDGSTVTSTVIAEHINSAAGLTGCVSYNGTLTITVTSSVGEGAKVIDITRVRVISSRPNL